MMRLPWAADDHGDKATKRHIYWNSKDIHKNKQNQGEKGSPASYSSNNQSSLD